MIFKQKRVAIPLAIVIVLAAGSAVAFTLHNRTRAAPATKPKAAAVKSEFSFTGTPGWWQGATNKTSMALFPNEGGCFVSMEHKAGTVDVAAELQKTDSMLTSDDYTVTPVGTQTLTLQTSTGQQQYELHQSSVTTPTGASKIEGGQEFSYLQLKNGYLKIMGYCDTPAELPTTIPALQAYKFAETI